MFAKSSFIGGALVVALVLGTGGAAMADVVDPADPSASQAAAPEPEPAPAPPPEPAPAPEPAPPPQPEPAPAPPAAPEPAPPPPAPVTEPPAEPTPPDAPATGQPATEVTPSQLETMRLSGTAPESAHGDTKDDDRKDDDGKDDDDCGDDDKRGGEDCGHHDKGEIKLVKVVVNDDGGTANPRDWVLELRPDGGAWRSVTQNTWTKVDAGTYKLRETGSVTGYDWTKLECTNGKGTTLQSPVVTVEKGAKVVCTFTNDDRKKPKTGELKLVKKVVNNDGGTAEPGDWDLQVRIGQTWTTLAQGQFTDLPVGEYAIRETGGPAGYDLDRVSCTDGGHHGDDEKHGQGDGTPSVTISKGAKVVCTFTNDDQKPPKTGELKLVKKVVNDDGGTAQPGDWDLQVLIDGVWETLAQSEFVALPVGTYEIRETAGPAGYDLVGVSCTGHGHGGGGHDDGKDDEKDGQGDRLSGGPQHPIGNTVTISKGAKVVCTFTNDDQPSDLTIAKAFDGLTRVGPGPVWEVSYLLTVDNSGQPRAEVYDLFDAPAFASGVTITGNAVVDVTNGNTPIAWNGEAETPIVSGVTIAAGAVHVYRVTFTVTLSGTTPPDEIDCTGEPGSGFFNEATLEWEGEPVSSEDCEPVPPQPLFDKVALGATAVDADTWALEYRLTVSNPGPGSATYTLVDTPGALPAGVTLVQVAAANDPAYPDTPPLATTWSSLAPVTLAAGQQIGAGITHAFLVTETVNVEIPQLPDPLPEDCADIPGVGYAIPNLGSIEVDGIIVDDEACNVIQVTDLGIVKSHSSLEGGAVEPGTEFSYYLDVTNHGTVDVTGGSVTDEIPADLDVLSVTVPAGWTDQSAGNTVLVEDVSLSVGETQRIEVRVVLPVPPAQVPPVLGPGGTPEPFEPEFIGDLVNEACVSVENDGDPTNDCDTVTVPVDELIADIFVSCLNDIAYLNYRVETSPSLAGEPISLTWTPDTQVPAPQPDSVQRTLASGDSGSILWPGGAVAPNDVSIQWPGYRPLTIADYDPATGALLVDPDLVYNGMVLDTSYPTYPWRLASTVTISVNPTLVIQTSYPPTTVNCEVPRSADLIIDKTADVHTTAPGASFEYGLSVTNLAVDSVAEPVVVTDIIPADIRVDEIVTSETAFPRWRACAVTGTDAAGFGGTLECTLLGPLAMGSSAPLITLGVTVKGDTRATSIVNTGEVCWGPSSNGLPYEACDDDSVTVTLSGSPAAAGLPRTGGEPSHEATVTAAALMLFGLLGILYAAQRRRRGTISR